MDSIISKLITLFFKRVHFSLIGSLLLGAFLFFFTQKLVMHFGFQTASFDLYFRDQSIWNVTQGKGLYLNMLNRNYFSEHFYPFFYLISLLYFIYPTPIWQFALMALLLCLTMLPILWITKEKFGKKAVVIAFVLMMANYGFREANVLYIYGETVIACVMSWIMYFLCKEKYRPVFVLSLCLPFLKETAVVVATMVGLYLIVFRKRVVRGLVIIGFSAAISWYALTIFIPHFSPESHYKFTGYYNNLGHSVPDMVHTIVTRPLYAATQIISADKILNFILLVLPLAFLPFFSSYSLLAVGLIAQCFISGDQNFYKFYSHHLFPVLTIFFFSSVMGLDFLKRRLTETSYSKVKKSIKWIFIFFVGLNCLVFVVLESRNFYISRHTLAIHRLMLQIPPNESVVVSRKFLIHLNYREKITLFPGPYNQANYVFVETIDPDFPASEKTSVSIHRLWQADRKVRVLKALWLGPDSYAPEGPEVYAAWLEKLVYDPAYEKIGRAGSVVLYRKKGVIDEK